MTIRQRKVLKVTGFVVLALVVFVFALARTFPYHRVESKLREAIGDKYDVEIMDVRAGFWPGSVVVESMTLKTRPTEKDKKPALIYFEQVDLDIGLFSLITGTVAVDVEATIPGGTINLELEDSKKGRRIVAHTSGLALDMLPWVKQTVGLPMSGPLDVNANIWLPKHNWAKAGGEISLSCIGCTVGDGKAKLVMTPPKTGRRRSKNAEIFAKQGLEVPKLNLGVAEAKMTIKDGVGTIDKFTAKSKDGWLSIDGEIKFAKNVGKSKLPGCLKFQLSQELKDREKKFGNIEFMLPEKSRQDDASYAIPLKGTLSALRPDVRKRCEGAAGTGPTQASSRTKPGIRLPKVADKPASALAKPVGAVIKPKIDAKTKLEMPKVGESGPSLSTELMRDGARKAKKEAANNADDDEKEDSDTDTDSDESGEGDDEDDGDGDGDAKAEEDGDGEGGEIE